MLNEYHLSAVERRVAQSIIRGETTTHACHRLGMARSRYKKIVHHLFAKTGSADQIELVAKLRMPPSRSPLESQP